ncbi:hypothetical protein [Novosphingobium sp. SG707]|uniref:hypothetical protein n=1 Tax=Novosphingobium sp. SG707 TaxID=2586996 RepID=UPI00144735C4|nr:hypothetical protein [Novosphingobium sp. SG707]NKJ00229.1 hypothetical protein [Novosphingobium sp. SG707]
MLTYSLLLLAATPVAAAGAMPAPESVVEMNQDLAANTAATQKSTAIESKAAGRDVVATPTPAAVRKKSRMLTILGVIGTVLGASIGI